MSINPNSYKPLNRDVSGLNVFENPKPETSEQEDYHNRFVKDKQIVRIPLGYLIKAPDEYNLFSQLETDPAKRLEMKFSIMNSGLFNPIIVWKEKEGEDYMILSGHTRVEMYKELYLESKDYQDGSEDKYEAIPAIVYDYDEIDLLKAKEIIIDTNYIQRDIDKRFVPLLVQSRADIVKNQTDRAGKTFDLVAEDLGLSRTSVYENLTLATKVIEEIASYYYEGYVTKKNIIKFAAYDEMLQYKIYEECTQHLSNAKIARLKRNMTFEEIKKVLSRELGPEKQKVTFEVPKHRVEEFKIEVNNLIKAKGFTQ